MTDLSKEALDARAANGVRELEKAYNVIVAALAETKALTARAEHAEAKLADAHSRLTIYEGSTSDPVSTTGVIEDMAGKMAVLIKENKSLKARADLLPTEEQIMAHPKVKALVDALEAIANSKPWVASGDDLRAIACAALRDLTGGE